MLLPDAYGVSDLPLPLFDDDELMLDSATTYRLAFMEGLKPDPMLTVSQWADEKRFLSQKAAAEPGRWRTSRTPYLRAIMDDLSATSPIETVVFMAGAQVGKTETGNNWFGYVVDHVPGPMLFVQPTVELAKRLSKQRLASMIDETPALRERIADARARDSGNTMLTKEFRGGVVVITGANSAVGLRSMPVRYLFLDEVDAYPMDVEGEGDPVQLAIRRTTTFSRRKIYMSSTPTIRDMSRIEREYLDSDQQRYFVPCPHCGHLDWMRWANIKWENDDPTTAKLLCESCGVLIEEHHKTDMLREKGYGGEAEWRATATGDGRKAGYHISSLYSPLGWKSWADIVAEFLKAKGDPNQLKEWVNTVLGETWEEEYSAKVGAEALQERCEEYRLTTIPMAGLLMTAGVDVQDNRLAVKLKAWGEGEESWLVNYIEIYGDPADLTHTGPWHQLTNVLEQEYQHESGALLRVKATAVDTGGSFTHEAYMYCRARKRHGVIAIKGSSVPNKPAIGKPSRQDVNFKGQTIRKGIELWLLGTDTIKSLVYGRLRRTESGPGMMHFPVGLPDDYFKQLTAEKQVIRYLNGFPKKVWFKKDGARNEALDCEVYAYAALQWLYTRVNRNTIWLQAKDLLAKLAPKASAEAPVTLEPETEPEQEIKRPRPNPLAQRRRSGGFVKRF